MSEAKADKYAAPALVKGLDILEYLAGELKPCSQAEIAKGLGRGPNEIFRVLVGLVSRGYLIRDEVSGKYRMSLKLYSLSRAISPARQLRHTALPFMEDLASELGRSCHLSMLDGGKVMILLEAQSPSAISLSIHEGAVFPIVSTTSGRILLANSRQDIRNSILEKDNEYKKLGAQKKKHFIQSLGDIREQGYELSESEITEGVTDCAALIGQSDGEVIAALAVSSLSSSMNQPLQRDKLVSSVVETARKITEQLGC